MIDKLSVFHGVNGQHAGTLETRETRKSSASPLTRDGAELARGRGLRATRLHAMKKYALSRLEDPSLSVNDVARSQGVSPRYVQKLFESEGKTFSSFLLQARLSLAYRRLSDPTWAHLLISAIAADCGFGDLSYFNQSFRRRYGETPSDVRNGACSRGQK